MGLGAEVLATIDEFDFLVQRLLAWAQVIDKVVSIRDVRSQEVVRDEVDRNRLMPRTGDRLLQSHRFVAGSRQRDLVCPVVREVHRDRGKAEALPIDFHQRPRWIGTDRHPPADTAARDDQQHRDERELLSGGVGKHGRWGTLVRTGKVGIGGGRTPVKPMQGAEMYDEWGFSAKTTLSRSDRATLSPCEAAVRSRSSGGTELAGISDGHLDAGSCNQVAIRLNFYLGLVTFRDFPDCG